MQADGWRGTEKKLRKHDLMRTYMWSKINGNSSEGKAQRGGNCNCNFDQKKNGNALDLLSQFFFWIQVESHHSVLSHLANQSF